MREELPVGGRLTQFVQFWGTFHTDAFVREVITQGHSIPFMGRPPRFQGLKRTPLRGQSEVLLQEIQSLLAKDAIEEVPLSQAFSGFFSSYFLVPKKTGELRPILNLKPLNKSLYVESFKMETLRKVTLAMVQGEWLASLDLKDAYFHVPVRSSHWKFLRFAVQNKVYQYKVLPFGLSTSPRVFTKVLAPVMAALRMQGIHVHPYLDDLLFRAESPQALRRHLQVAQDCLMRAGYIINLKKSSLLPSQDLVFIGGRFDTQSGQVFLPPDRVVALVRLVKSFVVGAVRPARMWLSLLGLMASTIYLVRNARWAMRPIQLFFLCRWSDRLPLTFPIMVKRFMLPYLQWWASEDNLTQGLRLSPPAPTCIITTDASATAWGGWLDEVHEAKGVWGEEDLLLHINLKEMRAVEFTLKSLVAKVRGNVVLVRSDNTTVCAYLNKQGGTRSPHLCIMTWRLIEWCLFHQVTLRALFLPGVSNVRADLLSRPNLISPGRQVQLFHQAEWAIDREVVASLFLMMGEPQIDLFATRLNAKLPQFCSLFQDQGEMWRDALTLNWAHLYGYAFPPFSLIPRVLSKLKKGGGC